MMNIVKFIRIVAAKSKGKKSPLLLMHKNSAELVASEMLESNNYAETSNPNDSIVMYEQTWKANFTTNEEGIYQTATFQNFSSGEFLAYRDGNAILLEETAALPTEIQWQLLEADNFRADDLGAPNSYTLAPYNNQEVVLTLLGNKLQFEKNFHESPSEKKKQKWYLESPRLQINYPGQDAELNLHIKPAEGEIVEVWSNMVVGYRIATIEHSDNPEGTNFTVDKRISPVYLSSKYVETGKTNITYIEEESPETSSVTLDAQSVNDNVSQTIRFYYGDPRTGTVMTVSSTKIAT